MADQILKLPVRKSKASKLWQIPEADLKRLEEERAERDREALKLQKARQERKLEEMKKKIEETTKALEVKFEID